MIAPTFVVLRAAVSLTQTVWAFGVFLGDVVW